jgi:hypothetical protein
MNKEFIPYEQALELKELGFDEPCLAFYQVEYHEKLPVMVDDDDQYRISGFRTCKNSEIPNHYTASPTYSQAFRWFREEYVLDSIVQPTYSTKYQYRVFNVETKSKVQVYGDYMGKEFKTYEEAELACLKKLIEIVKSNMDII